LVWVIGVLSSMVGVAGGNALEGFVERSQEDG
jgi:hypothetical protein